MDDDRCTLYDYNNNDDNKDLTPVYIGCWWSAIRNITYNAQKRRIYYITFMDN